MLGHVCAEINSINSQSRLLSFQFSTKKSDFSIKSPERNSLANRTKFCSSFLNTRLDFSSIFGKILSAISMKRIKSDNFF